MDDLAPARWLAWDASKQDAYLDELWNQTLNRADETTRPRTEFAAKTAAICTYSAAGANAWQAYGMPTYGIGVGPGGGTTGTHWIFGVSHGGGPTVWGHSVGGGYVLGASSEYVAAAWTLEGIPIFYPSAIYAMNRASANCAVASGQAFVSGVVGPRVPGVVYSPNAPWNR